MSYRVVNLMQGSAEWHSFRKRHIGASEIASVMGKCPYTTAYERYLEKAENYERETSSDSMRKGAEMEPEIRRWFEEQTGIYLMPQVIESIEYPWMSASLDGISLDGDVFVEIKFNNRENHLLAKSGQLVEHHNIQMQTQYKVSGDETKNKGYYISHHNGENIIVYVERDARIGDEIVEKGKEFWEMVLHKTPPALTDKDYPRIDNSELIADADQFQQNLDLIKQLEKQNDLIRKKFIAEVGRNADIGGLRLSQVERKGAIDYSLIPFLKELDIELYRQPSTTYWRLS